MKAILAILALAAVSLAANDIYKEFIEWSYANGKAYSNANEHVERFQNFKENWRLVRNMNRKSRATFVLNKFADMSQEEFAKMYLRPFPVFSHRRVAKLPYSRYRAYPETLDWVEKGAVTDVKDQGSCGSCWAFSATGNMEGVYMVEKGELPVLSEQQLVDCEKDCMIFPGTTEEVCDDGCNGGLMPNAFTYAIREGMMADKDYPYAGYESGSCDYDAQKATYHFSDWKFVDSNEDAMVAALNDVGPMAVAVDATYWSFYSGGIYDSFCSTTTMNHGVLLVGYGSEEGSKYWVIKNSWGSSWGEDGYMRIIRGENKCGINNFVCTIIA